MSLTPEAMEIVTAQLKRLEGFSETSYKDVKGYSIGYGHLIRKGEEHLLSARLTKDEAQEILKSDVSKHLSWQKVLKKDISANQAAALTLLEYNTGPAGAMKIAALMNEGKLSEAADVFLRYNKAKDSRSGQYVTLPGLVKRRAFERSLFLTSDSKRGTFLSQVEKERKDALAPRPVADPAAGADNKAVLAQIEGLRKSLGLSPGISEQEFRNKIRREANGL